MSSEMEKIMERLTKHLDANARVLAAVWQSIQLKEADKTPDRWSATSAWVCSPGTQQLANHNPNRASGTLLNVSGGTICYGTADFDVNEAVAFYTGKVNGAVMPVGFLSAGQSATIGSRGPIYVYSLGYSATIGSQNPSFVSYVQTVYAVRPGIQNNNPIDPIGLQGQLDKAPLGTDPSRALT